jgi:alkyl hydroperoxide reductase subunit AhpC
MLFASGRRSVLAGTQGALRSLAAASAARGAPTAAPLFSAGAVIDGQISYVNLDDYKGKWVVLFFYPKDFTFVCPTEIIAFSDRAKEFADLNCQVIAASTDTEECHLAWVRTPRKKGGLGTMQIPIVADTTKTIAAKYGVLLQDIGIALRGLFIINPEGIVEQATINNLPVGRDVDETLRLLTAFQFVAKHGEVCPAGWTPGEKSMVADPDGSMAYFETLQEHEDDFAAKLMPIKSKEDYEALIASGKPVVVDVMAPWCGKCRQIAPFVDSLIDAHPEVTFAKLDTTELEALSKELGVEGLPAFKFFKGGKEVVSEVIGYKKKPLEDAVKKLLAA